MGDVIYPKGLFDEWHCKECLLGECLLCGVETLEFCPCETNVNIVTLMQMATICYDCGWEGQGKE